VELRRFGTSGLRVSAFSLGAMTFGASQTNLKGVTSSEEEARRVFDRAVEAGINLVELTGEWAAGKRDQLRYPRCRGGRREAPGLTSRTGQADDVVQGLEIILICDAERLAQHPISSKRG
jgi:hypothetical protein